MATLYFKTAGGNFNGANWSTTGAGGVDSVTPTAADDCVVESLSGNMTINAGSVCRSLNFTSGTGSYTGVASFGVGGTLTIGDAIAGVGNVALLLSSGMTTPTGSGTITFVSTSTTQQTITTNGKLAGVDFLFIGGVGGKWQFQDTLTARQVQLRDGILDMNSQAYNLTYFSLQGSAAKTLTLGSSTVNISQTAGFELINQTNTTITTNTATFNLTGTNAVAPVVGTIMNGASLTLSGGGNAQIIGPSTWATVTRIGTAVKTDTLLISGGTLTCSMAFAVSPNSTTNRVLVQSELVGTARIITAPSVTITNTDFMDITGAGAGSWTGTSVGDCQGNSGITFTTPVTRYAVAAGNWSSTSMWSASSGGSSGASVPLPQDNVYLNASSGAGTYALDMPRVCKNLTCTGFTRTLSFNIGISIYGSITLGSEMTVSANAGISVRGRGSHTIVSAGQGIAGTSGFDISAPGGTYTLADAFFVSGNIANGVVQLTAGTFDSAGYNVAATYFSTSGSIPRSLIMGSSTWSLIRTSGFWSVTGTSLTISAASSTIIVSGSTANLRTFGGGGYKYGTLTYTVSGSTGGLSVSGNNYFDTLNFSDTSNARTLSLAANALNTVRHFNVYGASGQPITLNCSNSGSTTYLNLIGSAPTPNTDWLSTQDIYVNLPYTGYLGNNTVIGTNCTGCIVGVRPTTGPQVVNGASFNAGATSGTAAFSGGHTAAAGSLLIAIIENTGSTASFVGPSGWTLASAKNPSSAPNVRIYYKVSNGTETDVSASHSSGASSLLIHMYEIDTTGYTAAAGSSADGQTAGNNTTLSVGSAAVTSPAIAVIGLQGNSSLGGSSDSDQGFIQGRPDPTIAATNARTFLLIQPTATTLSPTLTWTTSRSVVAQMQVFELTGASPASEGDMLLMF